MTEEALIVIAIRRCNGITGRVTTHVVRLSRRDDRDGCNGGGGVTALGPDTCLEFRCWF